MIRHFGRSRNYDEISTFNQTLTHIVKQAEAQTGAGTATVPRALAEKINETAAPQDQVTAEGLRQRARETAGEKTRIRSNGPNCPTAQEDTGKSCSSCSNQSRIDPGEAFREVELVIKKKGVTVN